MYPFPCCRSRFPLLSIIAPQYPCRGPEHSSLPHAKSKPAKGQERPLRINNLDSFAHLMSAAHVQQLCGGGPLGLAKLPFALTGHSRFRRSFVCNHEKIPVQPM